MNNDRTPTQALYTRTEGTRSRGRQRKRWTDNVKEEVQKKATYKNLAHYGRTARNGTIFIQPHRQQPHGGPDGKRRMGKDDAT